MRIYIIYKEGRRRGGKRGARIAWRWREREGTDRNDGKGETAGFRGNKKAGEKESPISEGRKTETGERIGRKKLSLWG